MRDRDGRKQVKKGNADARVKLEPQMGRSNTPPPS